MNLSLRLRSCLRGKWSLLALGLVVSFGVSGQVGAAGKKAVDDWVGKNNFGGTGLFQTRSARSAPDGNFEVGFSRWDEYKRYYITLQGLPWLEGTFRYTEIRNRLFSPFRSFSGNQTFKDRGADLTFRLLEETKYLPALSLTLQDGLGTGQFAGEYLTANKRFYDLDFSVGMNWGYGTSGSEITNPFTYISDKFKGRTGVSGTGGDVNFGTYLSGENVAIYGGVVYRTPIEGMTFKLEYDPNDYQAEPQSIRFDKDFPFNFGFVYRPFPWLETSLAHERGNIASLRVSLRSNLHDPGMPKFEDPPPTLMSRADVETELQKEKTKEIWPKWRWPSDEDKSESTMAGASGAGAQAVADTSEQDPDAAAKLISELAEESLEITEFEIIGDEVKVALAGLVPGEASTRVEYVARIIGNAFPENSEAITITNASIGPVGGTNDSTVKIEKKELEYAGIVDHMFEGLETEGFQVESFSLSHTQAVVSISKTRHSATPTAKAARVVLRSVPTPIKSVKLVLVNAGIEVNRHEFMRSDIERDAFIDDMFDALDERGFAVGDVNLNHRSATLEVEVPERSSLPDFSKTVVVIAETAPTSLDEITIVAVRSGSELARATANRVKKGAGSEEWRTAATSGQSGDSRIAEPYWTTADKVAIARRLFETLREAKFYAQAVDLKGRRVIVYGVSRQFRQRARNLGRVFRTLANNVPPDIEELTIVTMAAGMEMSRVTIRRNDLENAVKLKGSTDEIWANAELEGPRAGIFLPDGSVSNPSNYPNLSWTFNPKLQTHVGGPNQFVLYRLFATAGFDAAVWRGLSVSGRINRNIWDNFGKIQFGSSSLLPHVRTDIKEYLQEAGIVTLRRLQANYYFAPVKEWYARISAGIFEEMFGGYSAEVLHQPFKSRFAIGADINKVWKRDFDQLFKFRDYNVITGHVNAYYDSPWYDVSMSAHIGRFLAGDTGVSFLASRTFDSGVRVGMWVTLTDVPAEIFGEGSFDKGFFISLPFELFMTQSSTRRGVFAFRPITRDGGARLGMEGRLHGIASSTGMNNTMRDWDRLLD